MVELAKNRTERFHEIEWNMDLWKKFYYKYQKDYIRRRLSAIKHLHEGKSRLQVCKIMRCSYNTLNDWMDKYIQGGLNKLVEAIKHTNVPQQLSKEQKQDLKQMILENTPRDYGINRNIWTGDIILEVIRKQWNIVLKRTRIYEILHELGLSYQKGHRDYINGDKEKQREFVDGLKKTGNPWIQTEGDLL